MKKLFKKSILSLTAFSLIILPLNVRAVDPLPETVVDIIVDSEIHETLEVAVTGAGLVGTLQGEGPFTVFAPTDEAFEAIPEEVLAALLADPSGDLTDILLYHVVAGKASSTDLSDGQMIETFFGEDVTVTINSEGIFINNAEVIVADLMAENGVVHVIDAVLSIPPGVPETVVDIIVESEIHETLEVAVTEAGLVGTLQGEGPFTVFAPTDEAFEAIPDDVLTALLADPSGDLTDILLYHVVAGKTLSSELSDGQMIETVFSEDVKVTINSKGIFINDAEVIIADLEAENGVVHVIDAVLSIPPSIPETVVDIIINSDVHQTLEDLVVGAGLAGALQADGPFTVFAPTDKAFERLPRIVKRAMQRDDELLPKILLHHVVSDDVKSEDIGRFTRLETLQGNTIFARNFRGRIYVKWSKVTLADLAAENGTVHVVNRVLIPWTEVFKSLRK